MEFSRELRTLISLNNNWSTALEVMETKDVMEDGLMLLLTMSKPTDKLLMPPIPILLEMEDVKLKLDNIKLDLLSETPDAVLCNLILLKLNPLQFVLMLLTGLCIDQEYSATVELVSTMPFSLLVGMLKETGSSRTLGELHGERMDTLLLNLVTPAEYAKFWPWLNDY